MSGGGGGGILPSSFLPTPSALCCE
jgi:hypothetical protein